MNDEQLRSGVFIVYPSSFIVSNMDLSADLRDSLAAAGAKLKLRYPPWLRPFLQRDVIGITLGRRIYLSPRVEALPPAQAERLIRHELAHVRQIQRLGV